jgi:WD40-like Beta Propeller Repeat
MKTTFKVVLVCLILLLNVRAHGQKYGNVWQLGYHIGMDFNNCDPVLVAGANDGFEGCAAISDGNGQLLFYTNSDQVWDRAHNVMPNGNLMSAGGTLSQVLIIPKPGSTTIYFIITTKIQASGNLNLQYHVVDMTQNAGLGNVTSANNIMSTLNITEQIAATYHANGTDIWLMAHEYGTNNFLAYLVTVSGIAATPVVSSSGPAHAACISNINARGEIKFSPDGKRLAFTANGVGGNDSTNILCLFDFDNGAGIIANPVNLPFSRGDFGLTFSPDNTKLYGTTWKAFAFQQGDFNYLYQFDLSSGVPATIIASKQIIDSAVSPYGSIKIGPDERVYVRRTGSAYIGVINAPNVAGSGCNYIANGFYIITSSFQYGLNNYIEYTSYCPETAVITKPESISLFSNYPNPFVTETNFQLDFPVKNARLIVRNSLGQTVRELNPVSEQRFTFSRENLPAGIYSVSIIDDGIILATKKIVIAD